jgi:hypothetical protein
MLIREWFHTRKVQTAVLVCAGFLIAQSALANAQAQKDYSSSQDRSVYANVDADGSSAVSKHSGQNDGYGGGGYAPHSRLSAEHFTFEGGGGLTVPTGSGRQFMDTGWNVKAGGGYRFNGRLSVMADYDYVSMGVPGAILEQVNPQGGGATHLWSLTVNPIYDYKTSGRWGGYLVGGGGFYRKVVNFTQPFSDYCAYYDPYYGCIPGTVNQTVAHFSNNAGGLNFGTGFTYRLSDSSRVRLFVEGKYVWVDNQASANNTASTGYTPANDRTQYIPITFGIRF